MEPVVLNKHELQALLVEAARMGAAQARDETMTFNMKDAAAHLGVSYNTMLRRIREGKIKTVDGRVTGSELRHYLTKFSR